MQLLGLHHVTAVTANAKQNLDFYTNILGLRLVKKTVNQDDTTAYHLFYADKLGTPGTDMTFFDWPQAGPNSDTNDGITKTMFRVSGKAALEFWLNRFDQFQINHFGIEKLGDKDAILFTDFEGQKLALINDESSPFLGEAWETTEISQDNAIKGFYAVELTVPSLIEFEQILTNLLNFTKTQTYQSLDEDKATVTIFTMDNGGSGKEVHVKEKTGMFGLVGAGGVHHVAFRTGDAKTQQAWLEKLEKFNWPNSGLVDRFYFKSLYFRVSYGILFELATDEPGFDADESIDTLGENLSLPPFLESKREEIEKNLKPL
jgi:glyoxalase family protein